MARRLMPDIAVCMGRLEGGLKPACPIRLKCHRFMAAADPHWRLYFDGRYKDGSCDHFRKNPTPKQQSVISCALGEESGDKQPHITCSEGKQQPEAK